MENYTSMLKKIPVSVRLFNMWHRGEPLAASHFPEMVEEATMRGIHTQTHTNGTLLYKKDFARRLVGAKLTRITIGVDGPDQDSYSQFRRGGRLEDVEAGVRLLAAEKKRQRSKKPKIIIECLVGRQTAEQFGKIKELALNWGSDEVRFKTYKVSDLDNLDDSLAQLPDDQKLWRYNRVNGSLTMKRLFSKCLRLGYSAVIAWNGDILPCCFTTNPFMAVGNILHESWKDIWHGEHIREFQRIVNGGKRDQIPMCRNCTEGLFRLYLPEKLVLK